MVSSERAARASRYCGDGAIHSYRMGEKLRLSSEKQLLTKNVTAHLPCYHGLERTDRTMYSNSRRSTFPGASGNPACLRRRRLDPGQLIRAHRPFALFGQRFRLPIDLTDLPNGFFFLRIHRRGQPVADQMRFEIPLFNTRAACRGEISLRIPRRFTSSAISRPVHWLIGRSLGCSQANAMIWHVCSAVISDGRPGRGTSVRRSTTETSSTDTACKPIQRIRQPRTVSTLTLSSLAISAFLFPSAAARIIRPRFASCWGVLYRRTRSSRSFRSSSLNVNSAGFGPFCIASSLFAFLFFLPFYHRGISAAMY